MGTRQTSINCYNQIKAEGLLSKRRFEVYEAIYNSAPCTTNEALKNIQSGSHGVGSRTTELRELGVIYEKGVRECRVTGRKVIEWDLTNKLPGKRKTPKSPKKIRVEKALAKLNFLREKRNTASNEDWDAVERLIKSI